MWSEMLSHWDDWAHPLRPNEEDVRSISKHIFGECVLVLGATPELQHLATDVADIEFNGIDWMAMPYADETFDCVISDGALIVAGPNVVHHALRVLKPGGKFIARTFLRHTSKRLTNNFHIKKFQIADQLYFPVQKFYDVFGDHPTTRAYNGSSDVYYFPLASDLIGATLHYPSYEFGEFYPVAVWTK